MARNALSCIPDLPSEFGTIQQDKLSKLENISGLRMFGSDHLRLELYGSYQH